MSSSTVVSPPPSDQRISFHRRPCTLQLPSSSLPAPSSSVSISTRKRRACPLNRIDLSVVAKNLSGSNESLNGADRSAPKLQTPSSAGGGDECLLSSSSQLLSGPLLSSSAADGLDPLKRLRLCSTSSTASSVLSSSSSESDCDNSSHFPLVAVEQRQCISEGSNHLSLVELDNDESVSPKQAIFASGGLVIGDELDGKFELVGDGRNCKAVHIVTQTVFHCQVMKVDEWRLFAEIMARMEAAARMYSETEFEQRRDLLLPLHQLHVVRSAAKEGLVYVLLPDHFGNLHQLVMEEELTHLGGNTERGMAQTRKTERQMQPILAQIVVLLEFCHRIGLYFRDFRLRKFVFTDAQKTKIRVNNILDLFLADDPSCDAMVVRELVPAYVAPEILDKKNYLYGGRAADVWAFGVLMFTLLNGRYPFYEASPSPIALLRRIRAHKLSFSIDKSLSDSARWLLHALLHQNPVERPSAEELLSAHWFRVGAVMPPYAANSESIDLANSVRRGVHNRSTVAERGERNGIKQQIVGIVPPGRATPPLLVVAGRVSPPAAHVPSIPSSLHVLLTPTEEEAPLLTPQAQSHSQRGQRSQRAYEERTERGQQFVEWTRQLRALLAHEPMVPRAAAINNSSMPTEGNVGSERAAEEQQRRRPAQLFQPSQRTNSETRRPSAERTTFASVQQIRRHGQPPAFVPVNGGVRLVRPTPLVKRTQPISSDDQAVPDIG